MVFSLIFIRFRFSNARYEGFPYNPLYNFINDLILSVSLDFFNDPDNPFAIKIVLKFLI